MSLYTWRGHGAKIQTLYETGDLLMSKVKSLLVITAALKILGLSTLTLILLTPFLIALYIGIGYAWIHWGWMRESQEVAILEQWSTPQVFMMTALYRLMRDRQIPVNGFEGRLPVEVEQALLSPKRVP